MPHSHKKLFLLDAMALIYRAFFALNRNPRINSKGLNTSAILGFANTLYDILKNEQPTHIGIAFDTQAPTQRHIDFEDYKANRERMPDDLANSIPYIMEMIQAFNIPILTMDGFEADDIIGTLALQAEKQGFETFMMTPDKDFGQLVSEKVFMYKPARTGEAAEIWGAPEVCERYGIEKPEQLIDILGLMGDTADNIPGVPGVGEKTAIKLINQYGSIDNIYKHTEELKGKLKENIVNFEEQARLSRQLATIITDVPVPFEPEQLKLEAPNMEALAAIFDELEFRSFAKRFFGDAQTQLENPEADVAADLFSGLTPEETGEVLTDTKQNLQSTAHEYESVQGDEEIDTLIENLQQHKSFSFDTETTDLDAHTAELVGISFAVKAHHAWFLPLPENYYECQKILQKFQTLFKNPEITKIGQNLKYDISVLRWYDIEVEGPLFDTMIAHYLIEPDQRHNMDFLAETFLNYRTIPISDLIGKKGKQQSSMRNVPLQTLKEYAAEDADITLQLKEIFEPKLKELNLTRLFNEIEMPLVRVLTDMEAEGVRLDIEALTTISAQLELEITKIEKEIFSLADTSFNIASPKQLGEILFEKMALSSKAKKTKTGQYSTAEDVLTKMIHLHPIIQLVLDYRSLTKLKSTYVDALPALVNPRDGRIHTSYNQAVASTGRLSSNNPNLQNIPIRTERGREIRTAFVARNKNFTLLAADYSQIELRIIAHLSGDKSMQDAFTQGLDIHTATAAKVYRISLDEVTSNMRRNAKMVNFGIIYGISAFGLSERLGISRKEAAEIIESYFREYPGIKDYMQNQIAAAQKNGYVETMLGRRRLLRDINNSNSVVRGFAERNAINAPIQGSSADMIKIAMIRIHDEMKKAKMESKMILQVHDELVFDAKIDELEALKKIIETNMIQALPLSIPVVVDMNTGNNWLEAH